MNLSSSPATLDDAFKNNGVRGGPTLDLEKLKFIADFSKVKGHYMKLKSEIAAGNCTIDMGAEMDSLEKKYTELMTVGKEKGFLAND